MLGDFYLDEDFELKIVNGDFLISDETQQDVNLLLQSSEGHLKNYPIYGINIDSFLNSNDALGLKRKIINQIKKINVELENIDINLPENKVNIETKKVNE